MSDEARQTGISIELLKNGARIAFENDYAVGSQSNFPSYHRIMGQVFSDWKIADEVRYEDQTLAYNGKRVFEPLHKHQSIRFYIGIPNF